MRDRVWPIIVTNDALNGNGASGEPEGQRPEEPSAPARLPVTIEGFSGPLEMLVQLIAKHDMDICAVNISQITDEYLRIIREQEVKDLDEGGDYLVLAATLIRYKSRALVPKEDDEPEDEEEIEEQLERRRQEYERFRQLADELRAREELCSFLFPRAGNSPEQPFETVEFGEVSVFDLHQTFLKILEEIGTSDPPPIEGESYSVDEKILEIEAILAHNERMSLNEYLKTRTSKLELIVVFLAVLEMIRLREVRATRDTASDGIVLEKLNLPAGDGDGGEDGRDDWDE